MIKTGMASVTFRQFDVDEVIRRTKEAGLMAIEWGGDVHVPHGDLDKARYTADKMRENGLEIASYGSYYRALWRTRRLRIYWPQRKRWERPTFESGPGRGNRRTVTESRGHGLSSASETRPAWRLGRISQSPRNTTEEP